MTKGRSRTLTFATWFGSLSVIACSFVNDVSGLTSGSGSDAASTAASGGNSSGDGGAISGTDSGGSAAGSSLGGNPSTGGAIEDLGAVGIYWVDSWDAAVKRSDIDGSNLTTILTLDNPEESFLRSIVLDQVHQHIYFTDALQGTVFRADMDGDNLAPVVSGLEYPMGIDIDIERGKLYFADQAVEAAVYRANLDGSDLEPIMTEGLWYPYGVALDLAHDKVYVIDNGVYTIFRSNLDGTDLVDLMVDDLGIPIEIKVDSVDEKLYWTDIGDPEYNQEPNIRRSDLDGTNVEDIITPATTPGFAVPLGLDLDEVTRTVYFVDGGTGGLDVIEKANLDGSNVKPLIVGLEDPRGLALEF